MSARHSNAAAALDVSVDIKAPPRRILMAFFDGDAISVWWQAIRSVTTPRVMGPYVVEWSPTEFRDETLGRLGGVFRGVVMQFDQDRGFFVADAYWLPPDGDPMGPMALDVSCRLIDLTPDADSQDVVTRLSVRQSGYESAYRWRHYYEVASTGWQRALGSLKTLLEAKPPA